MQGAGLRWMGFSSIMLSWWPQTTGLVVGGQCSSGDTRPQKVKCLPSPSGSVWMLSSSKREKAEQQQTPKSLGCCVLIQDIVHPEAAVPACQQQSDRIRGINFRGGKWLIIYLQLGRVRRRERSTAPFGFPSGSVNA